MDYVQLSLADIGFHLLVALPIFFLVRWLLRRVVPNPRYRTAWAAGVTIVLEPLVLLTFFIGLFAYDAWVPQRKFDQSQWLQRPDERLHMKDDVVERNFLKGRNKQDVLAILGKPTWGDTTNVWTYDMGSSGAGFGWAFHTLSVTFEAGKVMHVKKHETLD
jgi:hypothetical protein